MKGGSGCSGITSEGCFYPAALGVLSGRCPPLLLWGWQLLFHLADQDIQSLARDRHHLPFLGNRDGGCHGLHVEPPAFELVAERTLVLLEDLDVVLDREVPLQKLAHHLQIHCRLRPWRGL